ncbi:MAG: 4'-phosphopantetheinyl transferase superfamily protein [Pseudomonadota bacterium]
MLDAPQPLPPDEVQLWFAFPAELHDPALLARYAALMNDEERARHDRFVFARHRHEFLVARALVRGTLSRYLPGVPPARWIFSHNEHGRPELAGPVETDLRFNLSHTGGLILLGVVRGRDIGVDVEDTERRVSFMEIADRFFSPAEMRDLHALDPAGQRARFFHYWTLKEAYIKARGKGLAIPLHHFSYAVRTGEPLRIAIDPAQADEPASWHFALLRPTPRHTAALAVRLPERARRPDRVQILRTTPLSSHQRLDVELLASSEQPLG